MKTDPPVMVAGQFSIGILATEFVLEFELIDT
jgi:hypothetical protein